MTTDNPTGTLIEALPHILSRSRQLVEEVCKHIGAPAATQLRCVEQVGARADGTTSRIITGDNFDVMAALLQTHRGTIDMIYIDPPFDSRADYHARVIIADPSSPGGNITVAQRAYSDSWIDGTRSYLEMLTPRLLLMRELLAESGSIYVHLDWHVGHYAKILLDEIFGRERFRNEIVWCYASPGRSSTRLKPCHDTIFLYDKSSQPTWNNPQQPLAPATLRVNSLQWRGQSHAWERTRQTKDMVDWWPINFQTGSAERSGFHTQKPEALLERMIEASTHKGACVADFFGGCGTTAAVAQRLGRSWITCDITPLATLLTRNRLAGLGGDPHSIWELQRPSETSTEAQLDITVRSEIDDVNDIITVTLANYVPDWQALDLTHTELDTIRSIAEADSLALIDQWAIDTKATHDHAPSDEVFRAEWESRRVLKRNRVLQPIERNAALRIPRRQDTDASKQAITVRVIDVFGNVIVRSVQI